MHSRIVFAFFDRICRFDNSGRANQETLRHPYRRSERHQRRQHQARGRVPDSANAAQSTVEVKVFPASQLGQTREVIERCACGSGAAGTTGGPAEYGLVRCGPGRYSPAVRVEEL